MNDLHPALTAPNCSALTGLSQHEALRRQARHGRNEVPHGKARSLAHIIIDVLREPMLALLVVAALAYLALGSGAEAVILACFAMASIVLTVIQETRTEHVLDALRDLAAPNALVMRDGAATRLPAVDVVQGDVLILETGDRIAADCSLVQAADLQVDESLLTGESLPVAKLARPSSENGEQASLLSGTLVTHGTAIAEVTAIGADSQIGKIGRSLSSIETEEPRLRRETSNMVRICAIGGISISILVAALYVTTRGGWIDALLAGISVAMSMLPEEFPVVLTIFLAMGAWRIGQAGVLTRRAAAIETLGSATVLCTDKTGTLTENRMTVTELWSPQEGRIRLAPASALSGPIQALLKTAASACPIIPVDPMEIAIREAAARNLTEPSSRTTLLRTHGLSPDLPAMSNVWDDGANLQVTAKGSPEAIATLCRLGTVERSAMMTMVDQLAASGTRILGVARAMAPRDATVGSQRDYAYSLLGLIGLTDPLRPQIPSAVADLRLAGIRIIMVTGDHAATAHAIADQAGLAPGTVLTGSELACLSEDELAEQLQHVAIFARILPDQKLRIVRAYKRAGEVVGMIGDGVNDAPSLKAADIGVAMGGRGTDVAREAASIVLLDDDFGSIVSAMRLGRRIYDNIRKAMAFIFAVHVPLAGLALLPFALGIPIILGPVHIVLIEMIIDPVCALVFEAETDERDVMRRAPRRAGEPLFPLKLIVWSVSQGVLAFAIAAAVVIWARATGMDIREVRSLAFFSLVAMIVALILANRSFNSSLLQALTVHNRALQLVLALVVAGAAASLLIPPLRAVLAFAPVSAGGVGVMALAGGTVLVLVEITKRLVSNRRVSSTVHHTAYSD